MYLSKNKGRNRYEFFSYEIEERATQRRLLIEEIRVALDKEPRTLEEREAWDLATARPITEVQEESRRLGES